MLLYLMRHGQAIGGTSDSERPLSKQGRQEAAAVAQHLRQKGVVIDLFYQSTKKRAQETALIVKDILNPSARLETKDGIAPDDPAEFIVDDIAGWRENIMLVSHLPFIPKLISKLVTGREDENMVAIPTACVVILEHVSQRWQIKEIITPGNI